MSHNSEGAAAGLTQAMEKITELLHETVKARRYGDLSRIAAIAELVASSMSRLEAASESPAEEAKPADEPAAADAKPSAEPEAAPEVEEQPAPAAPAEPPKAAKRKAAPRKRKKKRPAARKKRARSKGSYPRFERSGEKLVSVGWSKRRGIEYAHRAPRSVIGVLSRFLIEKVDLDKPFTTDQILPLRNEEGGTVGVGHVYTTLRWFRSFGAISGDGRSGYLANPQKLTPAVLEEEWEILVDPKKKKKEEAAKSRVA